MERATERKWLRAGAALVIGSGALTVTGAHPQTGALMAVFADLLFWPLNGAQSLGDDAARLLAAIGGGVMIGWGWMLWQLAGEGIDRTPDFARRLIWQSVIAWFLVDCAGSIAAGALLNVVSNLGFLALFAVPLWRSERAAAA